MVFKDPAVIRKNEFLPDNKSIVLERSFVIRDGKFELVGVLFRVDISELVSDETHVDIILREACNSRVELRVH